MIASKKLKELKKQLKEAEKSALYTYQESEKLEDSITVMAKHKLRTTPARDLLAKLNKAVNEKEVLVRELRKDIQKEEKEIEKEVNAKLPSGLSYEKFSRVDDLIFDRKGGVKMLAIREIDSDIGNGQKKGNALMLIPAHRARVDMLTTSYFPAELVMTQIEYRVYEEAPKLTSQSVPVLRFKYLSLGEWGEEVSIPKGTTWKKALKNNIEKINGFLGSDLGPKDFFKDRTLLL